ncbi:hypothetical protein ACF0H5_015854 [Mactra antiquata]
MSDPEVVRKQPESNGYNQNDKIKTKPNDDEISYVDSDTHAKSFCCCLHGWKTGEDPRWYYPWDKGMYLLCVVGCMWYCLCGFVPCVMCNKTARSIICCDGQCGDGRVQNKGQHFDEKDEIAEA